MKSNMHYLEEMIQGVKTKVSETYNTITDSVVDAYQSVNKTKALGVLGLGLLTASCSDDDKSASKDGVYVTVQDNNNSNIAVIIGDSTDLYANHNQKFHDYDIQIGPFKWGDHGHDERCKTDYTSLDRNRRRTRNTSNQRTRNQTNAEIESRLNHLESEIKNCNGIKFQDDYDTKHDVLFLNEN